MLLSDSCIVNELPLVAAGKVDTVHPSSYGSGEVNHSETSLVSVKHYSLYHIFYQQVHLP